MILEKSLIPLYRLFPISFPRMEERQSPITKARATAERVSMTGLRVILKYGVRDASAVAAIWSSAPSLIK